MPLAALDRRPPREEPPEADQGRGGASLPRTTRRKIARVVTLLVSAGAAFLLVGNLVILGFSLLARAGAVEAGAMAGVAKFQQLDARLWRGAAPGPTGYASLVERGVATIVDLRHDDERGAIPTDDVEAAGVELVRIPIRDGQTPTAEQVDRFLGIVAASPGPVFVHCGAGVGRTGAMVAAYRTEKRDGGGIDRVRDNLAVGPPSLEQIVYAATLDGDWDRPHPLVVAASRVLDGPRRLWHHVT